MGRKRGAALCVLICLVLGVAPGDGSADQAADATAIPSPATADRAPRVEAGDVVVTGGMLFTGLGDELVTNPGMLIRNGILFSMDLSTYLSDDRTVGDLGAFQDARVIRLDDNHTVLAGLFDLHAHYAVDLFGEGRVDEYLVNPVVFLANGVTSTFPAGEVDPEGMRRARMEIDRGARVGARIHNSGPYFGTARPGWDVDAMTPDSIRAEVRFWAERGARGFKAKGIRMEQLRPLIDEAHQYGLTVTGHLGSGFRGTVNPRDAISMGIDRIEHFLGGDALVGEQSAYASLEALDANATEVTKQVQHFLEHGVRFDATLTAYGYFADREARVYDYWFPEMDLLTPFARRVVEERLPRTPLDQFERIYYVKRRTAKRFYDLGGGDLLTLGTDHPSWGEFFSGFGSHRELHAMVLAGIPNAAALRAGTINGARALGVSDRLGTLEVGKLADLFVVEGDPLQDIRATRNVVWVMKAGEVFNATELLESVRGGLGPASALEGEWWKGNLRFLSPGGP